VTILIHLCLQHLKNQILSKTKLNKKIKNTNSQRLKRKLTEEKNIGRCKIFDENKINAHSMGKMELTCSKCQAKFWEAELTSNNEFSVCCKKRRVILPELEKPPKYLRNLLKNDREFQTNIRAYNSVLAFASLGADFDRELIEKKGNYCFRIHGSVYHFIGSLLPENPKDAKFAQIYIYDTDFQTNIRTNLMPTLNKETLIGLQAMIQEYNPYVELFKTAASSMQSSNESDLQMIIKSDLQGQDIRTYNKPTSDDIAVVIPGNGSENVTCRDIIVTKMMML
jgi:hypothetical protein